MNVDKLRGKRCELHLTQEDVAKELGVSSRTYILKEKGVRKFTYEEAIDLANLFHVDVNYFVK